MDHPRSRPRRQLPALPPTLHPEQRLTLDQTLALVGQGRTWLYSAAARSAGFPPAEREGSRIRWRAGAVLDWLAQRRASPENAAALARDAAKRLGLELVDELDAFTAEAWAAAGAPGRIEAEGRALVPRIVIEAFRRGHQGRPQARDARHA